MAGAIVWDSKQKGNEQRERWKREDDTEKERAKPQAFIELASKDGRVDPFIVCYNLSSTGFLIDEIVISFGLSLVYHPLHGPQTLLAGQVLCYELGCGQYLQDKWVDFAVVVHLRNAFGSTLTHPVHFYAYPTTDLHSFEWRLGQLKDRQPGTIIREPRRLE